MKRCALCGQRIYMYGMPSGKKTWHHGREVPPQDHEATSQATGYDSRDGHIHDGRYADQGCPWCASELHQEWLDLWAQTTGRPRSTEGEL